MFAVTFPAIPLVPFPSTWVYYLSIFGLFYSIGGLISQRLALGLIGGIVRVEERGVFGQMIRFATAVNFYPVYLTLSRISSLPIYVRKPITLIVVLNWWMFMFNLVAIVD